LSPERSPATHAPVFLLHGRDDNVIPSTETPLVASYLSHHGNDRVQWLLTPIVSHAELQPTVSITEGWRLVRFWARVWAALDSN
jgi:predicted esterase